jgi:MFS transporter, PAT family, beta-lactamase induction signal transducer AmpG
MKVLRSIFQKNMLVNMLLGFSSGLPYLLTGKTLQAWMTEDHVDLKTIGMIALVGLPYTFKFLWAAAFDRFTLPFLGRRRGWLLLTQLFVAFSVGAMALISPGQNLRAMSILCLLIAFCSASQDVVVDAFRRESLSDDELAMGSTLYIYGYRIAMLVSGGLALILADHLSWHTVYLLLAAGMSVGIGATLWAEEPAAVGRPPRTLFETVVEPLEEFFQRHGWRSAVTILAFILLYMLGNNLAGNMQTPFYLAQGFTKTEIGSITKLLGFWSTLIGLFFGGALMLKIGMERALLVCSLLMATSIASLALLSHLGHSVGALALVISFEDMSAGMGTAAYTAFMASQTNKRFTALQYALLTSLMAVPAKLIAACTGFLATALGWQNYFLACAAAAVPGLLLLFVLYPRLRPGAAAT